MTQSGFTLQKSAILRKMPGSVIGSSQRRTMMSGGDPQPLQLLHRMLGGLGFVFAGRLQIGDQRDMDKQGVARACFMSDLTDGLDKGLALYITDGPADLGDHDISFCFTADIVDEAFDLVGDGGGWSARWSPDTRPGAPWR